MALLLVVRGALQCPGQRPNIFDIYGDGVGPGWNQFPKPWFDVAVGNRPNLTRRGLLRLSVHGSQYLYWKRTQLHGEKYRGRARHQDAVVLRLYGVFGPYPDSLVRHRDVCLLSGLS